MSELWGRVGADEGRCLRSMPAGSAQGQESTKGAGRACTWVRVREGCRQGADEGRSPRSVLVGYCKHYGPPGERIRLPECGRYTQETSACKETEGVCSEGIRP